MAENTHSHVGASGADRWWYCPGSVALSEGIPEEEAKEYASEGTVAHKLAEKVIKERISIKDCKKFIGRKVKQDGFEFTVTEEMVDAVTFYVFDTILPEASLLFQEAYAYAPSQEELFRIIEIEARFKCPSIHKDYRGTIDCRIAVPFKKVIIVDFKYGAGVPVYAEENLQALYYAAPSVIEDDVQSAKIIIVQPRMPHRKTVWEADKGRLDQFISDVGGRISATEQPNAALKATEKGCKWCRAKVICPEQKKVISLAAQKDFDSITEGVLPHPQTLSNEQIKYILSTEKIVTAFYKAVWEYALSQAKAGNILEGYELVEKLGDRKWVDEDKVKAILEPSYEKDIFTPNKLLSVAQMEKLIGKPEMKRVESLIERPITGVALSEIKEGKTKRNKVTTDFDLFEKAEQKELNK